MADRELVLVAQPVLGDSLARARELVPAGEVETVEPYTPDQDLPEGLARDCTALFADAMPANVEAMGRLRWIQLGSHGYGQLSGLRLHPDIVVTNASGVNDIPIAEWCLMMMLALSRDLPGMLSAQREHRWDRNATGAAPRRLPLGDGTEALTLRTAKDSLRIREAANLARQVLIIGAGFLGTEVAASLTASGRSVILVDPAPGPMAIPFGSEISDEMARLHRERGVDLRMSTSIDTIEPHLLGHRFALSDGTEVVSDCVIAAIGASPFTDWLRTSGLDLSNGVVCDEACQAAPGVYAAGDVAAWRHTISGDIVRVEHRMNATEQAMTVARNLMGAAEAFLPLPYFWTDQYDCKLQSYGLLRGADTRMLLSGTIAERKFVMAYGRAGQVVGVVGCNAARDVIKARRLVLDRAPLPVSSGR